MPINVKWVNNNTREMELKIYRSADKPVDGNYGAIIHTTRAAPGVGGFVDQLPEYGDSFYYTISLNDGSSEVHGISRRITCELDVGPGPKDLICDDGVMGYFGRVAVAELGISPRIWGITSISDYYKFLYKGRILYVQPLQTVNVATAIANKAITTGIETLVAPNTPLGEVRVVNGLRFAPRFAKVVDYDNAFPNSADYAIGAAVPGSYGRSELLDLIVAMSPTSDEHRRPFCIGTGTLPPISGSAANNIISSDLVTATTLRILTSLPSNSTFTSAFSTRAISGTGLAVAVVEYLGGE